MPLIPIGPFDAVGAGTNFLSLWDGEHDVEVVIDNADEEGAEVVLDDYLLDLLIATLTAHRDRRAQTGARSVLPAGPVKLAELPPATTAAVSEAARLTETERSVTVTALTAVFQMTDPAQWAAEALGRLRATHGEDSDHATAFVPVADRLRLIAEARRSAVPSTGTS